MDFSDELFLDAKNEEMTNSMDAGSPAVMADEDEEWDAEYWIIRDRPPYRV